MWGKVAELFPGNSGLGFFMALEQEIKTSQEGNLVTVTLNRPDIHNALNPQMVDGLMSTFQELGRREEVRVIVLTGEGRSFCAGADLAMMRAAADYEFDQNVADGQKIFDLMMMIDRCPKPVVGRINGAAIGGGVGLVSCCDIAVAVEGAKFGFSEARLGILPAVISPFVVAKIGPSNCRELFLTGERFDASHAYGIGLVQHVVAEEGLDSKVAERVEQLLLAAPGAQAAAKELIRTVSNQPKESMRDYAPEQLAARRASLEGKEGISAFLQKRKPKWQNT